MKLLDVRDLRTYFFIRRGILRAVDGVSFHVEEGEVVGIVGESGCGKSVTALSIMRLVPRPGRIVGGEILFKGQDLLKLDERRMRRIRGKEISMIFQEPMSSLNPVLTVGEQIAEAIRLHSDTGRREAWREAVESLAKVGIPSPELRAREYPHQMSGGMRQRVMIAMAIACHPSLLIADEPTTALDVTIQAQILDLIAQLKDDLGMSVMMITHDLGIVAGFAERVMVFYAGQIVEIAPTTEIFENPLHPYTRGLLASIPKISGEPEKLLTIPGSPPDPKSLPKGCRFEPRCEMARKECAEVEPMLQESYPGHLVRCFLN
jgi:oligopeptide/dipeptide ABC transporter ATP-binding protein